MRHNPHRFPISFFAFSTRIFVFVMLAGVLSSIFLLCKAETTLSFHKLLDDRSGDESNMIKYLQRKCSTARLNDGRSTCLFHRVLEGKLYLITSDTQKHACLLLEQQHSQAPGGYAQTEGRCEKAFQKVARSATRGHNMYKTKNDCQPATFLRPMPIPQHN